MATSSPLPISPASMSMVSSPRSSKIESPCPTSMKWTVRFPLAAGIALLLLVIAGAGCLTVEDGVVCYVVVLESVARLLLLSL